MTFIEALELARQRTKRLWCDLTHGGGTVTRDPAGRINWQCARCGRWSDPVPLDVEDATIDYMIKQEETCA